MGSSKESGEDLTNGKAQKRKLREDGASVTAELQEDKSSPDQDEVESSQALNRRENTSRKFSIRKLPSLINDRNPRSAEKGSSAEVGEAESGRRFGCLKSWRTGDDSDARYSDSSTERNIAVQELASLIAQKRSQGEDVNRDRNPQSFASTKLGDIELGRTREKGLAEFASLLEQKFRGSSCNEERNGGPSRFNSQDDRYSHGSKVGRQAHHSPRRFAYAETLVGKESGLDSRTRAGYDGGGGFAVVLPQSSPNHVEENVGEVEDESVPGLPSAIPSRNAEAAFKEPSLDGRKHRDLRGILEGSNVTINKLSNAIGQRAGEKRPVSFDGNDCRRPESKLSSMAAREGIHRATLDERNFPFKILSAMQSRTRGSDTGEVSLHGKAPPGAAHDRDDSRLERAAYLRNGKSLSSSKADSKNADEDSGDKIIPRHPRWTREETTALLASKRKMDEEMKRLTGPKIRSTVKRWDVIADYCKTLGVDRDGHQCRKRWGNLTSDFKRIRNWQRNGGGETESYWTMNGESRRRNKLPCTFDPQMFAEIEIASDIVSYRKKRGRSADDRGVEGGGRGGEAGLGGPEQLASALESSVVAMQAVLLRSIESQIQASNYNSELDRHQRKEMSDNLVRVLGVLAESLTKIAQRL